MILKIATENRNKFIRNKSLCIYVTRVYMYVESNFNIDEEKGVATMLFLSITQAAMQNLSLNSI